MMHITIPKPCHEDWNEMTPNLHGRHCTLCAKTVVDFTSMNDEEVKYFFLHKKKEESLCGRFKHEQLQRIHIELPYNIYTLSMPLWKQFLTACLLAFSSMLFSCDALVGNRTTGTPLIEPSEQQSIVRVMSIRDVKPIENDTLPKPTCSTTTGYTIYVESITKGDINVATIENYNPSEIVGEPAIEQPDTSQIIFTGKIAYDTSRVVNHKAIDTVKAKKDLTGCDNAFIKL